MSVKRVPGISFALCCILLCRDHVLLVGHILYSGQAATWTGKIFRYSKCLSRWKASKDWMSSHRQTEMWEICLVCLNKRWGYFYTRMPRYQILRLNDNAGTSHLCGNYSNSLFKWLERHCSYCKLCMQAFNELWSIWHLYAFCTCCHILTFCMSCWPPSDVIVRASAL